MIPFKLPILFTAWGVDKDWTTALLADKTLNAGFESIAVQQGTATQDDVALLQSRGLDVWVWGVANFDTKAYLDWVRPNGWMPQSESETEFQAIIDTVAVGANVNRPCSVVVTEGGVGQIGNSHVSWLAAHGFQGCCIETYKEAGLDDCDVMVFQMMQYGFAEADVVPLIGTYRGELPTDYKNFLHYHERFGVYEAEQTSDACWLWLANYAQNNYGRVVIDTDKVAAKAALDNYMNSTIGKKALSWWQLADKNEYARFQAGDNDVTHYATSYGKAMAGWRGVTI